MKYSLIVEVTPLAVYITKLTTEHNNTALIFQKNFYSNKKINKILTNYESARYIRIVLNILSKYCQPNEKIKILLYGQFAPLFLSDFRLQIRKNYSNNISITYLNIPKLRQIYDPYVSKDRLNFLFIGNEIYLNYKNSYSKLVRFNEAGVNGQFLTEIIKYEVNRMNISEIGIFMDKVESNFNINDAFIRQLLEYFPYALIKNEEVNTLNLFLAYIKKRKDD